jgi:hypothetical protein
VGAARLVAWVAVAQVLKGIVLAQQVQQTPEGVEVVDRVLELLQDKVDLESLYSVCPAYTQPQYRLV